MDRIAESGSISKSKMPKGPKHQKYILDSPFRSLKCQNTSSGHYFEVLDVEEQFWTHFFEGSRRRKVAPETQVE
ncbi:uncharacterized protein OCT59_002417 [Rhizophagus irregularis]|nr:hypothetical protein OCT59_002417 [Rhizophagus irregularis]